MRERLNHLWRIVATGLAFTAFGLGGVLFALTVFPILTLSIRDTVRRRRIARRIVQTSFAAFVQLMFRLGLLNYTISGHEKLARPGLLVLANHPTLIDVVFLISLLPNADCVVKSSLARNPFTRGPVRAAGYICNDTSEGMIEDCIVSLKSGSSLVIFPEGTRTALDGSMKLQRGAANIAIRGRIPVTPVLIRCAPRSLAKGTPWWKVPARPMSFTIEVLDDMPVDPFISAGSDALAARKLTRFLHDLFLSPSSSHANSAT